MKDVIIIGAGMAGLLALRIFRLRGWNAFIYESAPKLPNNHHAVLRFRSNVVSDASGISFKKVRMIKGTDMNRMPNPIAASLMYSQKCFGFCRSDRSLPIAPVSDDRWIAPPDFISQLAGDQKGISYNHHVTSYILKELHGIPVISTIPMNVWVTEFASEYKDPTLQFRYRSGYVTKAIITDTDAYVSLYHPGPQTPYYRTSITGNELTFESSGQLQPRLTPELFHYHTEQLGLGGTVASSLVFSDHRQQYAKIEPIPDRNRKAFMHYLTDKHNIWSLGRFATWRPGLLLDDLVKDINLIEKWIGEGTNYGVRTHRS